MKDKIKVYRKNPNVEKYEGEIGYLIEKSYEAGTYGVVKLVFESKIWIRSDFIYSFVGSNQDCEAWVEKRYPQERTNEFGPISP